MVTIDELLGSGDEEEEEKHQCARNVDNADDGSHDDEVDWCSDAGMWLCSYCSQIWSNL